MIRIIFAIVAFALYKTAKLLNLTYNEINIIVYYFIIPLTWCIMLDCIIGMPVCSIVWTVLGLIVYLKKKKNFSKWCDDVFKCSVKFLLKFEKIGWDYNKASVIICVVIPIIIYVLLIIALITI